MTTPTIPQAEDQAAKQRLEEARARRAAKAKATMAKVYRFMQFFYPLILIAALVGQTLAGAHYLGWPWWAVLPVAFGLEFAGVAITLLAEARQMLKERALLLRLFSAAVSAFAVYFNVIGHGTSDIQRIVGALFGFFTGLGYLLYLATSAAKRRDALRETGDLADKPPTYDLRDRVLHPFLTARARSMAKQDPDLGLYGSLAAAREAARNEKRTSLLAKVIQEKLTATAGADVAAVAVLTYDLDLVAANLRANADYAGLTALLRNELDPALLVARRQLESAPLKLDSAPPAPAANEAVAVESVPIDVDAIDAPIRYQLTAASAGLPAHLDGGSAAAPAVTFISPLPVAAVNGSPAAVNGHHPVIQVPPTLRNGQEAAGDDSHAGVPVLAAVATLPRPTVTARVAAVSAAEATSDAAVEGTDRAPRRAGPVRATETQIRMARLAYRDSVARGQQMTAAEVGALVGLSRQWGQSQITAVRAENAQTDEADGEVAQ